MFASLYALRLMVAFIATIACCQDPFLAGTPPAPQITPLDQNPQILDSIRRLPLNNCRRVNKGQQPVKLFAEDTPVQVSLKINRKCGCFRASIAPPDQVTPCTVTAKWYYCHMVNSPSPVQICYTVVEELQGTLNRDGKCCQVVVSGKSECVPLSKVVKKKITNP